MCRDRAGRVAAAGDLVGDLLKGWEDWWKPKNCPSFRFRQAILVHHNGEALLDLVEIDVINGNWLLRPDLLEFVTGRPIVPCEPVCEGWLRFIRRFAAGSARKCWAP
jgi:hypothetical protein